MRIFNSEKKIYIFKKKDVLFVICIVIILFITYLTVNLFDFLSEELKNVMRVETQNIFTKAVAVSIEKVCEESEFDFLNLTYNNGEVSSINYNTKDISIFKSKLIQTVMENVENVISVKLYYSDVLNNPILLNKGPYFVANCYPVGGVSVDFFSDMKEAGINQTKNSIYAEVRCTFYTGTSVLNITDEFKYRIPIAETIIVGKVPESYTNVVGEDTKDTVLNLQ